MYCFHVSFILESLILLFTFCSVLNLYLSLCQALLFLGSYSFLLSFRAHLVLHAIWSGYYHSLLVLQLLGYFTFYCFLTCIWVLLRSSYQSYIILALVITLYLVLLRMLFLNHSVGIVNFLLSSYCFVTLSSTHHLLFKFFCFHSLLFLMLVLCLHLVYHRISL